MQTEGSNGSYRFYRSMPRGFRVRERLALTSSERIELEPTGPRSTCAKARMSFERKGSEPEAQLLEGKAHFARLHRVSVILAAAGLIASLLLVGQAGAESNGSAARAVPRPFAWTRLVDGTTPGLQGTDPVYVQEAATLVEENQNPANSIASLSATFVLHTSPYGIGYELNGLSDTGDWYQGGAFYNWPGCPSGFVFGYEIWNNAGASIVGPTCDIPNPLSAGDTVELGLSLNCAQGGVGSSCLSFRDVTTGNGGVVTGPQPDGTAVYFLNLDRAADANGYFTGPMTEVLDETSSSCGRYASMPTVSYVIHVRGVMVSAYIPWSDEFAVGPFGISPCYSYTSPIVQVLASPVSQYAEATGGSSFGPHWEAGQDWSAAMGITDAWRFQTDVNPLRLSLSLSRSSVDVGQNLTVIGTSSGGTPTYSCRWSTNGMAEPTSACVWTKVPASAGLLTISGYVVDGLSDFAAVDDSVLVYSDPVPSAPHVTRMTLDLGQNVTLAANVIGGSGGYTYTWIGLPPGCDGTTATLHCTPSTPAATGVFPIRVLVTDSNGYAAPSPATNVTVSSDPTVTLSAAPESVNFGQAVTFAAAGEGGLAPYRYAWSGLPKECPTRTGAANLSCTPADAGDYVVTVQATDMNGAGASTHVHLEVRPGFIGMPVPLGYLVAFGTPTAIVLGAIVALRSFRRRTKGRPPDQRQTPNS